MDNNSWEAIYQKCAPKLIGVCRRYVKNLEVAEDLVHETFYTAITKYDTFSGKGSFEGWLRRIAVNNALMYLRKEEKHKENGDLPENIVEECEPDVSDAFIKTTKVFNAGFENSELIEIIDSLPCNHKIVFNLYVLEKYTHKQIAEVLNISVGTSKSHLARAKKKLQKLLYQKAFEKDSLLKKRSLVILLLLPTFAKAAYISRYFKKQFNSFKIATLSEVPEFLNQEPLEHMVAKSAFSTKPSIGFSKILVVSIASVVVIVSTFFIGGHYFKKNALFFETKNDKTRSSQGKKLSTKALFTSPFEIKRVEETHLQSVPEKSVDPKKTIPKKPVVVIKKQIIKKQTIKVHNKYQNNDSTKTN